MASGIAHSRASSILSIPAGVIVGLSLTSIPYGVGAALGSLLGIALTPDLDQISISKSEWRLVKKFGPLGFMWCAYWWLYAWIIPHRSFWSHFPIVGTVIRLLYITTPIIAFCIWKEYIPDLSQYIVDVIIGTCIGIAASDTLHHFMDMVDIFSK